MSKIQGPKEGKTYSNIYKEEWTQPWPMGSENYPEVHKNPRAFFSSSSPILLDSFIQYPWEVGLHHPFHLGKDLTSNPEVLYTLGSFPRHL